MKLTVKRSLSIAFLLFAFLLAATAALALIEIDRRVAIRGAFTYRHSTPVICEESGFVAQILKHEDEDVSAGEAVLVLENRNLEMEIVATENRLVMYEIELEEILSGKEFDSTMNRLDINRIDEELAYKREKLTYYEETLAEKKELYDTNIGSKDEYEAALLDVKTARTDIRNLQIALAKTDKGLEELDTSVLLRYRLKDQEFQNETQKLDHLMSRKQKLTVIAKSGGRLIADKLESLKNTYLGVGTHLADVVSFDDINFVGLAEGTDVVRISPGQEVFFNVELFRRKEFVKGRVARIGNKLIVRNPARGFPVEIEVDDKEFFNRKRKLYIQAGVPGEAIIITEKNLTLVSLLWDRFINYMDID